MANVTQALLQPLGTHTKPHKARLALDCASLPKEELYVTLSKPQAQKKPEGEQPLTGFCQRWDLPPGFKPDQVLPWLLSRREVQFLFPDSKHAHHYPWKAKGEEMCCFTLLDPMHSWPEGRPVLYTMTTMSAHDTGNLNSLSLLPDIPQLSVPPSSSKGCSQTHWVAKNAKAPFHPACRYWPKIKKPRVFGVSFHNCDISK